MTIRCEWCGWTGNEDELDLEDNGMPSMFCPACGSGNLDIRPDEEE